MSEILQETTFIKNKIRNLPLFDMYSNFNSKKANQVLDCGSQLWFNLKEHTITGERKKVLDSMFTCKDRFCPFCNWRRSLKYSKLIYDFLSASSEGEARYANSRYIFLTLTVKNCHVSELRDMIKHMQSSFNKMTKYSSWKKSILGFIRVLEITVEKKRPDYVHPHFHILLNVPSSYFDTRKGLYLKKDDYASMWQKALNVGYKPVCDVRIVKSNKDKSANAAVVSEMCKYPLKDTDLSRLANSDFEILVKEMKGLRSINCGGSLKDALKKIDKIDDDLVHLEEGDVSHLWVVLERMLYQLENKGGNLNYYKKKPGT